MAFISIILCAAVLYLMRNEIRSRRAEEQAEQEREVLREERSASRMDRAARREELLRILAVENEQRRQAEEQKRQAGILEKHGADIAKIAKEQAKQAEQIRKLTYQVEQAEEDINYLYDQIDSQKRYGAFLLEKRDACAIDGAEWHKWNNKMLTNDSKVYSLQTRMNRAVYKRDDAMQKLEEVA